MESNSASSIIVSSCVRFVSIVYPLSRQLWLTCYLDKIIQHDCKNVNSVTVRTIVHCEVFLKMLKKIRENGVAIFYIVFCIIAVVITVVAMFTDDKSEELTDYEKGYEQGYKDGYGEAEDNGIENSSDAYDDGYDEGYNDGYDDGYDDGCDDGQP